MSLLTTATCSLFLARHIFGRPCGDCCIVCYPCGQYLDIIKGMCLDHGLAFKRQHHCYGVETTRLICSTSSSL
ncbi:hypothetical protein DUNSADRAFT_13859 [Dunaliella salina]|uniref:Secreted protein n=1 Tax=Dunaliella salina TaxID=3046 RepID=A0ABQ7H2X9_DUNSA|nr:hypothetical protein DUNSADRAFT_13859 [Dunaliella salina]|eukprot:KAF5841214.1 hypothetical protein DUNSADRAFT_13859 [Dunaliella salina]